MKKIVPIIICTILGIFLFIFCYNYQNKNYPNEYYNVYLDGEYLGSILSKNELEDYINEKTEHLINIKEITKTYCDQNLDNVLNTDEVKSLLEKSVDTQYYDNKDEKCVDIKIQDGQTIENIYTPNGLEIEKTIAYNKEITSVEDIYSKIVLKKSFTIKGYQFTITNEENDKTIKIYTTSKDIFESAVKSVIETYVGKDEYNSYLQQTQKQIETTGSIIQNVYINEDITVKEKQIPVNELIYTSSSELAQFLLYGDNPVTKTYTVKEGEMVSDIAYQNEISSQEFLISNPKYKDEKALIKTGTEVSIKQTNPQIKVVVEMYTVEDKESEYKTIYQYDDSLYVGTEKISQEGENGLERVSQRLKIENGATVYVEPKGKETLKATKDKIIIKGDKAVPNVGDLSNWGWPSESGWTSTDGYEWRIHPITGERAFHYGIDIAGTGYNSDVYAANNGTIIKKEYHYSFGNYIVIDHNNGYYTLYAHMNKFASGLKVGDTVARGQLIGYVGSTGYSTGPHIHFEVWKGCEYCRINPWSIYK
jgi:murein DD-endopeptidase MepM/ murein hydrolase activator NlpD